MALLNWAEQQALIDAGYTREDDYGPVVTHRRRQQRAVIAGLRTAVEAAEWLGITPEQVSAFVRDGELRYINMGRGAKRPRYRFAEADLNELIEKRKEQGVQCLFSNRASPRHTGGTTSSSLVVGFTALREAQIAAKLKR
jgi:excisionase family DNA binding protein